MTRIAKARQSAFSLLIAAALAFGAVAARAGGRVVNLAEMTAAARRVVHGRVVEARPGRHPQQPNLAVLFVKIEVIEMLKGAPAREVTFMQYAGGAFSHLPQYRSGEEIVLFLYPESRLGLTSPVGEGQGKFTTCDDVRTGRRVLRNEQANFALFDRLDKTRLRSTLALSAAESAAVEQPQSDLRAGLEMNAFRSIVRKLAANPKAAASLQ